MQNCERCKKESKTLKMSFFNTEMTCPSCEEKEQKHPKYAEAKERERAEVLRGNYNYEGIGLPKDLK